MAGSGGGKLVLKIGERWTLKNEGRREIFPTDKWEIGGDGEEGRQ